MDYQDNMTREKILLISIVALIAVLSVVSGAGVSSEYWSGPDARPLSLPPQGSKEVTFSLQNMVGSGNLTFKVELKTGQEIAKLTDSNAYFDVPFGSSDVPVHLLVTIPANVNIGARYPITLTFTTVTTTESGQFRFGSAFEKSFDVVVVEKPAPAPQTPLTPPPESPTYTLWWILAFLIIIGVGILLIILKKKKK